MVQFLFEMVDVLVLSLYEDRDLEIAKSKDEQEEPNDIADNRQIKFESESKLEIEEVIYRRIRDRWKNCLESEES